MTLPTLRRLLRVAMLSVSATISACGSMSTAEPAASAPASIVLFGEVHDNAAQHELRLAWVRRWLESGARPVMLFEPFDRQRQSSLDEALARSGGTTSDDVILAGSGAPASEIRGWHWPYYAPLIQLALQYRLPILAANVSREETRQIIRSGLAAAGFRDDVPADIMQAQSSSIEQSHCGMIDAAMAQRMASAQVARDQFMAQLVESNARRDVLLIAGNGHVRRDIGVPRWLSPATRERTQVIGMIERSGSAGAEPTGAFSQVYTTEPHPREDPCNAMRAAPRRS